MLGRVLTGRMAGVALSAEGRAQAARLADRFGARTVAAVLSSPMQRAQETAAPIAARCGLAVTTEPGLDEIDFGDWTGAAFAELDPQPAWQRWNAARGLACCPGGETMLAAQARAVACVQRAAEAYPDGEVVLVSHQDVLKAIVAHVLGVPLDLLHRFAIDPAHRCTLVIEGGEARLRDLNLPP